MRDPNRIGLMTVALHDLWAKYPDLRLGQLVENLALKAAYMHGRKQATTFYIEDGELLAAIQDVQENGW